jgi:hypothetical protein
VYSSKHSPLQMMPIVSCVCTCVLATHGLAIRLPCPAVVHTRQGDSALVLDALMYRRGISSKEISVSYHKACQLLSAFEHVDFLFIPRWVGAPLQGMPEHALQVCVAPVCMIHGSMLAGDAGLL